MSHPIPSTVRADDLLRHLQDQKGVLAAIVELELHQRIFETDWRILPISWQKESRSVPLSGRHNAPSP